jgi:ABC-2 type transport system permease protein
MRLWLRQVLALALKELLTILKDPKSRFVVIAPPVIQFFVFGYAATFDVKDVAYAVVDEDRSTESRELLARFAGSESFSLVAELDSVEQIDAWIDPGDARLVLHVGPGFSERLHQRRPAELQVIVDGRNSNVSGIAQGYVQAIVAEWSGTRAPSAGSPAAGGPSLQLVQRAWYNPTLDSRWFIVSGLPVQIALIVVTLITALSVAREREQGTFDQTLVAPLGSGQILVGKSIPAFAFGLLDGLLLSAGAVLWFGVPLVGTVGALSAVLACYALSVIGVGLFISALSSTMQQGMLGAFLFIMPAVILSGFTTPIENMPGWLQTATLANPARYAVAGCRAVFLEGAGVMSVSDQLLPMLAIALLTSTTAAWMFRRRTE